MDKKNLNREWLLRMAERLMKKKKIVIPAALVFIAAAAFTLGRGGKGPEGKPEDMGRQMNVTAVSAEPPVTGSIELETAVTGTIEPSDVVYLYARAAGDVTSVLVKAGDTVEAGQLLAVIDTKQVEAAENAMESARLSYESAQSTLSRQELLYAGGDISEQEYEQYQNQAESSRLAYESAKMSYETQVEYSNITAPVSGVIESCSIEAFDHVSSNEELCVISGEGAQTLKFKVTERVARHLSAGGELRVEKDGETYSGSITEVSGMADASTGLFEVKGSINGADSVASGSVVKIYLVSDRAENVMTVPVDAVYFEGGVGMMVDNSIVVLESCFRAAESNRDKGIFGYAKAALLGSNQVLASIIGGTATTCVVFLPLAAVQGMSGQMFGPLGYTVVFCMLASLLSAITVVPLCYVMYKPQEKSKAFMSRPVERLQNFYRKVMKKLLRHKGRVMAVSATMLAATFYLASGMRSELITSDDTGQINIEIETRPGLLEEKTDDALARIEEIVSSDENVESYMLRYQNQSGSVTAYLKDDRTEDTDQLAEQWQQELSDIENISAEVTAGSSMSFMQRTRGYETILTGTDYEELKEVSDQIVSELISRDDVLNIHSSFENNAPIVSIDVDPLMASRKGLTASSIGSAVNQTLSGMTAAVLTVDGEDLDVKVEFPEGEYATIDQMKNIILTAGDGTATALTDVADIVYKDSPSSISREDKAFKVTITGEYTGEDTSAQIDSEVIAPNLTGTIKKGTNSMNRMMNEEFSSLYQAIAVAVFLIFVVMAAQFESVKFSFMVMTTIPFSLIGSFGFLKLTGVSMSMTSILGFLILVGTVVNNGILYVDTVNQYRMEMDMETAMIEAGATRLRPMLMTSLTTILGMIPMAAAMGSSGSTTQGLAIVDIGGLTVGLFVALFMLPVYYGLMNRKPREINEDWDID